jgi:hypothetical protein
LTLIPFPFHHPTSQELALAASQAPSTNLVESSGASIEISEPTFSPSALLKSPTQSPHNPTELPTETNSNHSPAPTRNPRPPTLFVFVPGVDKTHDLQFGKDNGDGSDNDESKKVQTSTSIVDSMPAFVIGFASSIILCAGYAVFSAMKDRCKEENNDPADTNTIITTNRQMRQHQSAGQSVLAGSSYHGGRSVFMVSGEASSSNQSSLCYERGPDGRLYPIIVLSRGGTVVRDRAAEESEHADDDKSLSGISDMTSLAMESVKSGRRVLELSEIHRVPADANLQSLVNLGALPATVMSTSSHSSATVSIPAKESLTAPTTLPNFPQQLETSVIAHGFDTEAMGPGSVMTLSHLDDSSVSEEDESGWTSSAGKSDSSSEVSIGTYLKSICSVRSRSSARSVETERSSILLGESLNPCPEKISQAESREDGDSMEFSIDASITSSEVRVGVTLADDDDDDDKSENPKKEECLDHTRVQPIISTSPKSDIEAGMASTSTRTTKKTVDQDHEQSCGSILDAASKENDPAQLGQFLEKNKYAAFQYDTESSIVTSKSSSVKDSSVLSGAGSGRSSIRSIKLMAISGSSMSSGLGLEVSGASCPASNPVVSTVKENSPAANEVFVGDVVLAVNDMDTAGWNDLDIVPNQDASEETCWGDQSVKLTIMSAASDGSDTGSTSSQESIQESSCSLCIGSVDEIDV